MSLRLRISASAAFFSLVISAAWPETAIDAKAWWADATRAFGLAAGLEAQRSLIRIEELDEEGAVTSYESGETYTQWAGTERKVSVVRAEKDGKDVSESWRKRYEKAGTDGDSGASRKGGPPSGYDATPFDPKYATRVTLGTPRPSGAFVEVPYIIATDGGAIEGVAVFTASGQPMSAVQDWTKPPMFVSSMRSALSYGYSGGALVISGMRIEGKASILLVKKRFRMSFEFSEWRRPPKASP